MTNGLLRAWALSFLDLITPNIKLHQQKKKIKIKIIIIIIIIMKKESIKKLCGPHLWVVDELPRGKKLWESLFLN